MKNGGGNPASNMATSRRRICIGTATRNRPVMLQRLLSSYERLLIPDGVDLHFVVVENNEFASLDAAVAAFRTALPACSVCYEIEPRIGIVFARNRILELALSAGCELLTFVDDDEEVDSSWLVSLLKERDAWDLDIVGSPVRLAPLPDKSGIWSRLIWRGLDQFNRKREHAASMRRANGRASDILIPTGSWMGRLSFFESSGLRFDEQYSLSGGEDERLWLAAKKLGARTGWTPDALVFETIPAARLTMRYQFMASSNHAVIAFRAKLKSRPTTTIIRFPGSLAARLISLIYYTATLPVATGSSLVRIAWHSGALFGILRACFGGWSKHYQSVTGN
ncbi:MAG: glycosyltransferase family 2 protein [Rhizobiaceae bacterium]